MSEHRIILKGYRQMTRVRLLDLLFVGLMSLAGLAAGVLSVAISDGGFSCGLGVPFAAIMAFCLALTGTTRNVWKLVILVALTACAFSISVVVAIEAELAVRKALEEVRKTVYPTSLCAGGMAGGLVVLVGALLLFRSKIGPWAVAWRAILWSLLEGALAPIAWALGPTLGIWVWSGLHAAGVTGPANTLQNALYGETGYGPPDSIFALLVVWQTVMGLALGVTLRPSQTKTSFKGDESV